MKFLALFVTVMLLSCLTYSATASADGALPAPGATGIASHLGMLKIVILEKQIVITSWRGDIVAVDLDSGLATRQLAMDVEDTRRDAFSFDVSGKNIYMLSTDTLYKPSDTRLIKLPISELKQDKLATPSLDDDDQHPLVKFTYDYADFAYIDVLGQDYFTQTEPFPFTEISVAPTGQVNLVSVYKGTLSVDTILLQNAEHTKWQSLCKIPGVDFTDNFVCYHDGDHLRLLTADGMRYELAPDTIKQFDDGGKPVSPATAPTSQPTDSQVVALVVDKSRTKEDAYRLFFRNGAWHAPVDDPQSKEHERVIPAINKAVTILATAPSVDIHKKSPKYADERGDANTTSSPTQPATQP